MSKAPRILQFGTIGQLGTELIHLAEPNGVDLQAVTLEEGDFTRPDDVVRAVRNAGPLDAVVNAAAYTAVDKAESNEALAAVINAGTVGVLAACCAELGVPLIHVSTDYVYDGRKTSPYVESDPVSPQNVYGRTKLAGEEAIRRAQPAHVILRTSWVYSPYGANFVKTMLRLAAEREELRVVDDQFGAPTAAADLAQAIFTIVKRLAAGPVEDGYGVFHYTGGGETTWCRFAQAILEQSRDWSQPKARIVPITTADYPTPAARPENSRLDCGKIKRVYGIATVPWQTALGLTLDVLKRQLGSETP